MNFDNAHRKLLAGSRIRRKAWEPLMHMVLRDEKIRTYKGEYSNFYGTADIMLSNGWTVLEGDGKELTFLEALDELKNRKRLSNNLWNPDIFIFVDGENIAICKPVECEFTPSFKCLCSSDWEVMK